MVASPAAAPPPAVPPSALTARGPLVRGGLGRFTVDDVQAMLKAGLLADDASTELLDGCIVRTDKSAFGKDPSTHSPAHRYTVVQLTALAASINSPTCHAQIQSSIVCGPDQMPQPDFAIIRGPDTDYVDRLPTAADVLCLIEVADSSLERDREEKLPVYARAGVPQYIILNLRSWTAEVSADSNSAIGVYPPPAIIAAGGSVSLKVGQADGLLVQLRELFP